MIFPSSNLGTCALVGVVDSPDEPRGLVIAPGDFLNFCRMKRRKHDQNDTRTTVNLFWVLLTSYRQSVCSFIGSRKQLRRTNLVPFFRTAVGCIASPRYASKLFLWTSPECFGFIPTFWVKRLSSCLLAVCQQCKTPSEIRLWSSGILKSQEICLSQQLWHFSVTLSKIVQELQGAKRYGLKLLFSANRRYGDNHGSDVAQRKSGELTVVLFVLLGTTSNHSKNVVFLVFVFIFLTFTMQ